MYLSIYLSIFTCWLSHYSLYICYYNTVILPIIMSGDLGAIIASTERTQDSFTYTTPKSPNGVAVSAEETGDNKFTDFLQTKMRKSQIEEIIGVDEGEYFESTQTDHLIAATQIDSLIQINVTVQYNAAYIL